MINLKELKKCSFDKIFIKMEYDKNNYKNPVYIPVKSEGYIIGEFYKYSGIGHVEYEGDDYFGTSYKISSLQKRKRINFYKVLTEFNNICFVNKDHAIIK
ncbi:MAG: hypothetical protein JSW06_02875 [Thermoplasmatales archaeon]|nr:MAG: hypothetical protein JSW06_02875 [Thermoplasmatales archaeon]